jgi:FtsZ-binding cell division protein ZapB
MAAQAPLPDEDTLALDALSYLEERIRRAVELVATLRAERDTAVAELEAARSAAGSALTDSQKNRQELEALRANRKELESLRTERKEVRTRIEKLLAQMDSL